MLLLLPMLTPHAQFQAAGLADSLAFTGSNKTVFAADDAGMERKCAVMSARRRRIVAEVSKSLGNPWEIHSENRCMISQPLVASH